MQRSIVFWLFVLFCGMLFGCDKSSEKTLKNNEWTERRHSPINKESIPEGCNPVKYKGGYYPITAAFEGSGSHCVVHDFLQRKVKDWIEGGIEHGNPRGAILSFYNSNNSDLNLRGHFISGSPFKDNEGVSINPSREIYFNLRVHNGIIETPGLLGIGVKLAPNIHAGDRIHWLIEDVPIMVKTDRNKETGELNEIPWDYSPPTFYTAENLQIKSGGRAIIMAGSDNVVRNNTIEVDGRTAVYLYGPRSLVEGNTFIVHMDPGDKAPLPAILKLRDAHGSIIRNNRFIVKRSGLFRKKEEVPQAGINLLQSRDVLIEGNVFEQVDLLVRQDEVSTVAERSNTSQDRK